MFTVMDWLFQESLLHSVLTTWKPLAASNIGNQFKNIMLCFGKLLAIL